MSFTLGILDYPGAQAATVLGLRDMLEVASRLSVERGGHSPILKVRILGTVNGLPDLDSPLTALILPPSLGGDAMSGQENQLVAWIKARHGEGTTLCSVCAGAFLLAETGLLAGRAATTHWGLAGRFAERFPDVKLDVDKLIIDDGDLITAGGLMAWLDLGLKLVDRFLGPGVMLETARFFLVDPGGREQRFYRSFAPHLSHGDPVILKVQHWLQTTSGEKITLTRMASAAILGERTFLRRFQKATGLNPTQYLQQLRVGKARDLLELSGLAIDRIAWQVGYEDPAAFRKIFLKIMGLTPGEYRRRFAATPRA